MTAQRDKETGTYYRLEYRERSDNASPVTRIELTHANATHLLHCSHVLGSMRKTYHMRCHVLRELPGDRLRVLVFGDRNWQGHEDKHRVRTVDADRVHERIELSGDSLRVMAFRGAKP